MQRKCLLFAYGTLQPGFSPPKSMSNAWTDRVHGVLYDLGDYPAAVLIDKSMHWIEGQTIEIDADELPALDAFEDVEGGEFLRKLVETEQGFVAWVYEYQKAVSDELVPVTKWVKA